MIIGTGVITFFYSSVLNLAKVFLDPYDNESYGGRLLGISINVATLLQETNVASRRFRRAVTSLPTAARPLPGRGQLAAATTAGLAPTAAQTAGSATSGATSPPVVEAVVPPAASNVES